MATTYAHRAEPTPSSSIEQAQQRLTQALDRLHTASVALAERHANAVESRWDSHASALEKECAILKEENEKLNHLLHEAINKYARLFKVAGAVGERLDQTIEYVETLIEREA